MTISTIKSSYLCLQKEVSLFCSMLLLGWLVKKVRSWFIQFATLFHTLKHGRPMVEYEAHKELFDFLSFEKNSKIHWIDGLGYGSTHAWHCFRSHQICCWSSLIHFTYL